MCRPVTCSTCSGITWAGCGQHVDDVRASVPAGQWCTCDRDAAQVPPAAPAASRPGFLSRLLGR